MTYSNSHDGSNPFDEAFASGWARRPPGRTRDVGVDGDCSRCQMFGARSNVDVASSDHSKPWRGSSDRASSSSSPSRQVWRASPLDDVNRNASNDCKVSQVDIFFKNRVVVRLDLDAARLVTCTCRELVALVLDEPEVGLPRDAETIFALWLVSPLFEVQLKPEHRPFGVWRKWPELLAKYTTSSADKRETDRPYLSFQRDVFCSRREETRLATLTVLELLYEEAKGSVLQGRYPCDQVTVECLAGMQARIELGKFDPDVHTTAYFRSKLESFVPAYACRRRSSSVSVSVFNFGSKSGLEYRIWLQFRAASDDLSVHCVMRRYLDACRSLPFYGSAFFAAQLEKPCTGLAAIVGYRDLPVCVAVNADGVTIISPTEGRVLLRLRYRELSWDSARPAQDDNPDCLPCLFLQFQAVDGDRRVFKVLQVFSKQAILMDAIISSFVRALRQSCWDRDDADDNSATAASGDCTPDGEDVRTPLTTAVVTSGAAEDDPYGSNGDDTDSTARLDSKLRGLSLATFNEDGDCIELMGSWAFR